MVPAAAKLRCRDGKHIGAAVDAVVEEQDVYVPARCEREGAKVVDADGDFGVVGQREGEDGPTNDVSGSLVRLLLTAAAYVPAGGNVDNDPPEKRASMQTVWVSARYKEVLAWPLPSTQVRISIGTRTRGEGGGGGGGRLFLWEAVRPGGWFYRRCGGVSF